MTEQQLDAFNQALRANDGYRALLRSMGVNPDGPVRLTDQQRKTAEQWVRANVADIGPLEIDPAGNVNQNEGLGVQLKRWAPVVGGAALTLFGVPGTGFSGLLGGGSGTAAGSAVGQAASGSGLLPGGTLPLAARAGMAGLPGQAAAAAAGSGGGLGSVLRGIFGNADRASMLASLGGAFSMGEKADRTLRAERQQDYDQMMLQADLARQRLGLEAQAMQGALAKSALDTLARTSALLSRGTSSGDLPPIQIRGRTVPVARFPWTPGPPTAEEAELATLLRDQALERARQGVTVPAPTFTPADPSTYTRPGLLERIGSYGAAATGILGALFGRPSR